MTLVERFMSYVSPEPNCGCWLWVGGGDKAGYGFFRRGRAHRRAWEMFRGPIPEGLDVLHRCDVPGCVNPDHLWIGTHADNMADMKRKGRAADRTGFRHSEETKQTLSEMKRGNGISSEQRERLRVANLGRKYPNRKRPRTFTEEHRANISFALAGKKKSPETRARMVEAWRLRRQRHATLHGEALT